MSMAMKYAMKKRMARGGEVKGVHKDLGPSQGMSSAGAAARTVTRANRGEGVSPKAKTAMEAHGKSEHERVLGEMKSMPGPTSGVAGFATGGLVDDEHEQDADMIARIMHKRKMYSEGGKVANDVGMAEADEAPAEYDDLVLRDELETSSDGENSGDRNGSKINQEEGDMISRIMSKRKQSNPRLG